MGSAVRGALSLGLHLRNEGPCTSDVSKEIRYRVWWSLYTIEHLLTVMTGRPSCIADNFCTTPLPVPFDECEFQKEEVARLIRSPYRGSSQGQLDGIVMQPATPGLSALDPDAGDAGTKDTETGSVEFLKGLSPCMSLYFIQLASLTAISKRMMVKLYSPEAALSPWPTTEFTIQSLMLEIDSWLMDLPSVYDFTSTQTSQCPASQRMSLALYFYSTKLGIARPCLCRQDSTSFHDDKTNEFCNNTAAECVESACHMLTLLPETPDAAMLNKISPWWCILHFIMQSTTVLLLELALKTQHVPDKEAMVSKAVKKAVEWLFSLSKENAASGRAWKLCDGYLRRLAPHVGLDISDLPTSDECSTATAIKVPAEVPGAAEVTFDIPSPPRAAVVPDDACVTDDPATISFDSIRYSPMDGASTPVGFPLSYGLDPTEHLEFLKNEKQLAMRSPNSEFLSLEPTPGQISGPFNFSNTTNNMDLDLEGYLWCDSIS